MGTDETKLRNPPPGHLQPLPRHLALVGTWLLVPVWEALLCEFLTFHKAHFPHLHGHFTCPLILILWGGGDLNTSFLNPMGLCPKANLHRNVQICKMLYPSPCLEEARAAIGTPLRPQPHPMRRESQPQTQPASPSHRSFLPRSPRHCS